jgi:hypothetical protein
MYSDGNYGFLIRDADGGDGLRQAFRGRERGETNAPKLVLVFE